MRPQFKKCVECGQKFFGDNTHGKDSWRKRKYCSVECKKNAQVGNLRADVLTKSCEHCAKKFHNRRPSGRVIEPYKWKTTKYCSRECKVAASVGREAHNKGVKEDIKKRFLRHVKKNVGSNKCWEWQGSRSDAGYGYFQVDGIKMLAHRVSFKIFKGEIPEGKGFHGFCVCHTCDNPPCVRPSHLFLGTQRVNIEDRDKKNRRSALIGDEHGMSKLIDRDVLSIREIFKLGEYTQKEIGEMFGVSGALVSRIVNRKNWTHF